MRFASPATRPTHARAAPQTARQVQEIHGASPPVLALGRLEQAMPFASINFGALQTSWQRAQWGDPVAYFLVAKIAKMFVVGTDI